MLPRTWIFAGLFGSCALVSAAQAQQPVRLASPVEGERLEAGERAWVEWTVEPGYLSSTVTEWEAFLSIDGGRTYPIRLTPHLDIALSGFSFEVPNVPSTKARLLLRFGNEKTERAFAVPTRFEIVANRSNRWVSELWGEPLARTLERGEPARQGDRGVVLWLEGDRRGGSLHSKVRVPVRSRFREVRVSRGPLLFAAGPESGPPRIAPPATATIDRPSPAAEAPFDDDLRAPLPLRLRIHRFNE